MIFWVVRVKVIHGEYLLGRGKSLLVLNMTAGTEWEAPVLGFNSAFTDNETNRYNRIRCLRLIKYFSSCFSKLLIELF